MKETQKIAQQNKILKEQQEKEERERKERERQERLERLARATDNPVLGKNRSKPCSMDASICEDRNILSYPPSPLHHAHRHMLL